MEKDATFQRYEAYTIRQAKRITKKPVKLVVNPNAHTQNAYAHMLKYSNPTHYSIVFSGGFYKFHKHNESVIKNIILHELAHIKEPYEHDMGFKRVAKNLGALARYQGSGSE